MEFVKTSDVVRISVFILQKLHSFQVETSKFKIIFSHFFLWKGAIDQHLCCCQHSGHSLGQLVGCKKIYQPF